MKNLEDVCFVIQARLGSQRIPDKMLRPFAGTTLIDIALRKIRLSKRISPHRFYLAVHEDALVDVGNRHGVQIFRRSRASAHEETDLQRIYEWHDKLECRFVIKINACAPLLPIETIDRFVDTYLSSSAAGLFSVIEKRDYYWSASRALQTPWPKGTTIMNTKLVEPTYQAAHCLYASRRDLIAQNQWMGSFQAPNDPELFVMSEIEAFDIDYEWQFEMCEAYYKRIHGNESTL